MAQKLKAGSIDSQRRDVGTDGHLRVALINGHDYAGGAETVMRALARCLQDAGHPVAAWVGRVNAVSPSCWIREIPKPTDAAGCRGSSLAGDGDCAMPGEEDRRRTRFLNKGYFGLGLEYTLDFCRSAAFDRTDVVHLHNLHGHYLDLRAIALLAERRPLVWTLHDFYAVTGGCAFPFSCSRWRDSCGACPSLGQYPLMTQHDRTRTLLRLKRNWFADVPVTLICPSRHLATAVESSGVFGWGDVRHVPYGVDTSVFHPHRERARRELGIGGDERVLFLAAQGLDDPRKGVSHAVRAMRALGDTQMTLLLAGKGDVAAMLGDLPLLTVRHAGYVSDPAEMARLYAAADLYVFPSLAENFPCSVMESMACGTPVLAFAIDGVTEQVTDGRTGFLVPLGDAAAFANSPTDAMADAIADTMAGVMRRAFGADLAAMGVAARAHAEREWALPVFLGRHMSIYREVSAYRAIQA